VYIVGAFLIRDNVEELWRLMDGDCTISSYWGGDDEVVAASAPPFTNQLFRQPDNIDNDRRPSTPQPPQLDPQAGSGT
jgi:hypothetical protein